jgi:ABC-type transporter Mla maintaining outer membrane lipid asymmetry ATPase subunit MlaF
MQLRELHINNYRGIASLSWRPASPLTSIIGPGDVGKSTVLDAIEAVLAPRWVTFTDADFHRCDTTQPIEIVATVGELPEEILRENRLGLLLRGWSPVGELHDEPETTDEGVVTVRLSVDVSLEPVWEIICDHAEPKTLSPRDRALFGVVRLGADVDRHFTWAHGSALARLGTEKDKVAPLLAEAYRRARELLSGGLPGLNDTAEKVRDAAALLGAYSSGSYSAGLDMQRASMSLGVLALHEAGVPIRLAGLGTRRLIALAIERLSIPEGAIVLVDEVEHGLEPHRIRQALKFLRDSVRSGNARVGQVIMTTHSAISIVELVCSQLTIARRENAAVVLQVPATVLQPLIRRIPEAFLGRSVLVCEGKTEVGLLRGMRDRWAANHDGEPLEAHGVVLVDGNGKEAVATYPIGQRHPRNGLTRPAIGCFGHAPPRGDCSGRGGRSAAGGLG